MEDREKYTYKTYLRLISSIMIKGQTIDNQSIKSDKGYCVSLKPTKEANTISEFMEYFWKQSLPSLKPLEVDNLSSPKFRNDRQLIRKRYNTNETLDLTSSSIAVAIKAILSYRYYEKHKTDNFDTDTQRGKEAKEYFRDLFSEAKKGDNRKKIDKPIFSSQFKKYDIATKLYNALIFEFWFSGGIDSGMIERLDLGYSVNSCKKDNPSYIENPDWFPPEYDTDKYIESKEYLNNGTTNRNGVSMIDQYRYNQSRSTTTGLFFTEYITDLTEYSPSDTPLPAGFFLRLNFLSLIFEKAFKIIDAVDKIWNSGDCCEDLPTFPEIRWSRPYDLEPSMYKKFNSSINAGRSKDCWNDINKGIYISIKTSEKIQSDIHQYISEPIKEYGAWCYELENDLEETEEHNRNLIDELDESDELKIEADNRVEELANKIEELESAVPSEAIQTIEQLREDLNLSEYNLKLSAKKLTDALNSIEDLEENIDTLETDIEKLNKLPTESQLFDLEQDNIEKESEIEQLQSDKVKLQDRLDKISVDMWIDSTKGYSPERKRLFKNTALLLEFPSCYGVSDLTKQLEYKWGFRQGYFDCCSCCPLDDSDSKCCNFCESYIPPNDRNKYSIIEENADLIRLGKTEGFSPLKEEGAENRFRYFMANQENSVSSLPRVIRDIFYDKKLIDINDMPIY
tara:strand:- start:154 stop:2196 length:2043 start_codon:yes stop_codon:yes gene_type:complete